MLRDELIEELTNRINEADLTAIQHHGVKGMKWGVRRDRGGSGGSVSTTTSTGRTVTAKDTGRSSGQVSVGGKSVNYNRNKVSPTVKNDKVGFKPKDSSNEAKRQANNANAKMFVNEATDAELRSAISRIKMEKEFRDLTLQANPAKAFAVRMRDRAVKTAEDIVFESAKAAARPYVADYFSNAVSKVGASKAKKDPIFEKESDGKSDSKPNLFEEAVAQNTRNQQLKRKLEAAKAEAKKKQK